MRYDQHWHNSLGYIMNFGVISFMSKGDSRIHTHVAY